MSGDMSENNNMGSDGPGKDKPPQPSPRTAVAQQIEENLKLVYQASLAEPVPDRFVQLLAQLREKEGKA